MKTLDEVIDYCEGKQTCGEWVGIADALHYLKEYRQVTDVMHKHGFGSVWGITLPDPDKVEGKPDIDGCANMPLTWQELKQMEGKPVWVEQRYQKMWGLNDGTYVDAFGDDCITIKVLHGLCHFEKNFIGITWNAYRKERG